MTSRDEPWLTWPNVPLPPTHLGGMATVALLQHWRPLQLPGSRRMHQLIGWPILIGGGWLIVRSMQSAATIRLDRPERIVETGPYAVSRHPMYVAWALLHLGAGVARGSAWTLVTWSTTVVLMNREMVREERSLVARFGEEYERYRAAVPRYAASAPAPSA